MPLYLPTITQSNCIWCKSVELQASSVTITVNYTGGTLKFYLGLSADPSTVPTVWEEVSNIISGTGRNYTINGSGQALFYKIVKDYSTIISTVKDANGRKTGAAIRVKTNG